MPVSELTDSAQNILKVVWALQEWDDAPVTSKVIAERVGVTVSTVSGAVSKLTEQGLLEHERYGQVSLTPQGRTFAVTMVRRHRLIETFLVQVLGYRWDEVHDEAEHLEHAVSELLVERIDAHLGHPRRDPHGDPIPAPDGSVEAPDAVLLSAMATAESAGASSGAGRGVVVERVSDHDPQLLQHLADQGIEVGITVDVAPGPPYSDAVEVTRSDGGTVTLGRVAADAVWVSTSS